MTITRSFVRIQLTDIKKVNNLEYRYKLCGIEKLDEKSLLKYKSKIAKIENVESVEIIDGCAVITVNKNAYEYDVLQTLIALSDEYDVEVDFGNESAFSQDNGLIDGDLTENETLDETKTIKTETDEKATEKEKSTVKTFDYDDRLAKKKSELKKDTLIRLGELSVSLVLFVISVFLKSTDSVLSFKMIMLILSFSLSGYDVVFNAVTDVIKKRPLDGNLVALLSSISLIILGQPNVATLLIFLFAVGKFLQTYSSKKGEIKKESCFYTGSTPVDADGNKIAREDVKKGCTVTLFEGDTVPTDGIILKSAEASSYVVNGSLDTKLNEGDLVLAGAVVLSKELTYKSTTDFNESRIDDERKAFEKSVLFDTDKKASKTAKIGLYADLSLIVIALLVTFLLPLKEATYLDGLKKWAVIGASVLSVSVITESVALCGLTYKNLYADARTSFIKFQSLASAVDLGSANSAEISAKALTENGKLKDDSLGALYELNALGVKKITVDFDCDVESEDKKKIDFVQPDLSHEKVFVTENGDNRVIINKDVVVLNNEVSFVPLAYKMSKKAVKAVKAEKVLTVSGKILILAGLFLIPFAKFNVAYLALLGALLTVVQSALSFSGFTKNK